jgi:hypothetical protein
VYVSIIPVVPAEVPPPSEKDAPCDERRGPTTGVDWCEDSEQRAYSAVFGLFGDRTTFEVSYIVPYEREGSAERINVIPKRSEVEPVTRRLYQALRP